MTALRDAPSGADVAPDPSPRGGWARPVVAVLAVVGLLLLGAAGGLLLGLPGSSTAVPAADSVDVGFAQDMSEHHQQAAQMAAWERDHTTDPALRQLAFDIETTQLQQIGRMQGWLGLWGAPVSSTGGHMAWMSSPSSHDHAAGGGAVDVMPGMATTEQLRELRAASGQQLDVLFLQLMLRHHEGGVVMLRYGAEHAAVPEVRNLAAQMLSVQTSESDYLRQLLVARGGTPLPL